MIKELSVAARATKHNTKLSITKTTNSRLSQIDFNNIPFGRIFSDHIFTVDYQDGAWQENQIVPYENMSISPACSALHYGQSIFEGMKAHKDMKTGEVLLFRPDKNIERLNISATRMAMPNFPEDAFMDCLKDLIDLDRKWVPEAKDAALYLRPLMFGNDNYIGVKTSKNYRLLVFTCPVGAYYSGAVSVVVGQKYVRAFPGGTGDTKAAGNYGPTLYPAGLAKEHGYDQVLWTDGLEHKYVHEIGTMNVFFIIDGVAVTPELDGCILPGITRQSVIQLLQDNGVPVEERKISVEEIITAQQKGLLQDAFGTGTAATITPISNIGFNDKNYELPALASRSISLKVKEELEAIKRGLAEDRHNWLVRV